MPLDAAQQTSILDYCDKHLPNPKWFSDEFDFIEDQSLRDRLAQEFYAARYVYKLGEALSVKDDRLHAHVKFQIVQYASIYEAVIVYLLWSKFSDHAALTSIQFHEALKVTAELPKSILMSNIDGEEVFLCVKRREKTNSFSIKFNDKVDAAVTIGFVQSNIAAEIKEFYRLRNAIHLETAVKKSITYELDQALLAYTRMRPFIDHIKANLSKLLPAPQIAAAPASVQDADTSDADISDGASVMPVTLPEQQ